MMTRLEALGSAANRTGMARYGINTERALGISVTTLKGVAREVGRDHALATRLWASGIHEARMLATLIDQPAQVSAAQMEAWVADFDSWDLCDGACGKLFWRTPHARDKIARWTAREPEFVRRAGFALIAWLAVHDKKAGDADFLGFLRLIEANADDERNFVKKAVSWALRQIGKRNQALNAAAVDCARRLAQREERAARWVGKDALRELGSEKVRARLGLTPPGGDPAAA